VRFDTELTELLTELLTGGGAEDHEVAVRQPKSKTPCANFCPPRRC
jgi:hypothetical protein